MQVEKEEDSPPVRGGADDREIEIQSIPAHSLGAVGVLGRLVPEKPWGLEWAN